MHGIRAFLYSAAKTGSEHVSLGDLLFSKLAKQRGNVWSQGHRNPAHPAWRPKRRQDGHRRGIVVKIKPYPRFMAADMMVAGPRDHKRPHGVSRAQG